MPRKALIVEDEAAIAKVLAVRLGAAGFEVKTASTGVRGLADAAVWLPDVIVLDVRLPDLDGFDVFARLRANPRSRGIPVVFLSASVQDTAKQRAIFDGASAYMTKPYDPRELINTLNQAIESRVNARTTEHEMERT